MVVGVGRQGGSRFHLEAEAQCSYYSPCVFWMNSIPSQWCLAVGDGWWIFAGWRDPFLWLTPSPSGCIAHLSLLSKATTKCLLYQEYIEAQWREAQTGHHSILSEAVWPKVVPQVIPFSSSEKAHLALEGHLVCEFRTGRAFSVWFNLQHSQSEKPPQPWSHRRRARKQRRVVLFYMWVSYEVLLDFSRLWPILLEMCTSESHCGLESHYK